MKRLLALGAFVMLVASVARATTSVSSKLAQDDLTTGKKIGQAYVSWSR